MGARGQVATAGCAATGVPKKPHLASWGGSRDPEEAYIWLLGAGGVRVIAPVTAIKFTTGCRAVSYDMASSAEIIVAFGGDSAPHRVRGSCLFASGPIRSKRQRKFSGTDELF
jgi:hypothetical protein